MEKDKDDALTKFFESKTPTIKPYDIRQTYTLPYDLTQDDKKSPKRHFTLSELKYNSKTGKTAKIPLDSVSGYPLSYTDHPERILTYKNACAWWFSQKDNARQKLRLSVLLEHNFENNQDLICVDIDHRADLVKQARAGKITSTDIQAQVVKFAFDNDFYIEVSQSGEGLHLLQMGHKDDESLIKNSNFEYYSHDHWITLTGDCLHTTEDNFLGLSDATFKKLEAMMFPINERKKNTKKVITFPNQTHINDVNTNELIEKAMNAKNGATFKALYHGGNPNGDASSGDMSFTNMLAFWTQKDAKLMDKIFRASGRMRPKWDEIHSAEGLTYGQMTIQQALNTVQDVYHPKTQDDEYSLYDIDKSKIKTNKDLINALREARIKWDNAHTSVDKSGNRHTIKITTKTEDIVQILVRVVNFAVIYKYNENTDMDLYYFDYDKGIYSSNLNYMETLVLALVPQATNGDTRRKWLDTIFKTPNEKVPHVQDIQMRDEGKTLLAVGNGILNFKTKQLMPYSPDIYITRKIDTNYNPNATVEPTYNGWSWVRTLKIISDGDVDKLKLLWEVTKAGIIGASWLRQAVLLVDDGHGMTGKSTFEDVIINVIGRPNVAPLRLDELSDENKLLDATDKRTIIGDDNNVSTAIKRYDYLNPVISGEILHVKKLYKDSISTVIHAFVLQSSNGIPQFLNATQAFFNRLVIVKFNHRHDASNEADWRVKNDYIKRKEFKEWLLWYVINNVELGIHLTQTQENKDLIADSQEETDTITNFVKNWIPQLQSKVIPAPWLYNFYCTACVIDGMKSETLSQKAFSRNLMNNDLFKAHWIKKNKRVTEDEFLYSDVCLLMDFYNSTRWGKDLKTWFPITNQTIGGKDDPKETKKVILEEDYRNKIEKYHHSCFIRL